MYVPFGFHGWNDFDEIFRHLQISLAGDVVIFGCNWKFEHRYCFFAAAAVFYIIDNNYKMRHYTQNIEQVMANT